MKKFNFGLLGIVCISGLLFVKNPLIAQEKAAKVTNKEIADYKKIELSEAGDIYEKAVGNMKKNHFKSAAKGFEKLQTEYPYSKWAMQAQLMEAYCLYQIHKYEDAIDLYSVFVKLHPQHEEAPYAQYMVGLCHYERIAIVERDQEDTEKALESFKRVLELYPVSDFAKDAKFKIDFLKNHIAAADMRVGRFYQKEKSYIAAINRFKRVVEEFQTTEQVPEALLRLAECYAILNFKDEFLYVFELLKINHAKSKWFEHASKIFSIYIEKKINVSGGNRKIGRKTKISRVGKIGGNAAKTPV